MAVYDVIVVGAGGVGSAAAYHAAKNGARVLALEQFTPAHNRGSSHGQTRIIRQAYFEHPDYVPLLKRAYALWLELEHAVDRQLFVQTGLVEIGPPGGVVLPGLRMAAKLHDVKVQNLEIDEQRSVVKQFPQFHAPPGFDAVLEPEAGYLLVEDCVAAHHRAAEAAGAELRFEEPVRQWRADDSGVSVRTDQGEHHGKRLIIAAGAWSASVLDQLQIPLRVMRKDVYWFANEPASFQASQGCPAFFYEAPEGYLYGVPAVDQRGVKIAEHSGGEPVVGPAVPSRGIDAANLQRVSQFANRYLNLPVAPPQRHETCFYTLTPDDNFIVDRHPRRPTVSFAAGLSGHGFKFTGVLGETLARLALDEELALPMDFLSLKRPAIQAIQQDQQQ